MTSRLGTRKPPLTLFYSVDYRFVSGNRHCEYLLHASWEIHVQTDSHEIVSYWSIMFQSSIVHQFIGHKRSELSSLIIFSLHRGIWRKLHCRLCIDCYRTLTSRFRNNQCKDDSVLFSPDSSMIPFIVSSVCCVF